MALTGDRPRLTGLSHGAGCACKIGAADFGGCAGRCRPAPTRSCWSASTRPTMPPSLLVPDLVLVQSLDFFTPIVDDPRDFGRIAAANALSDLYAMAVEPGLALNLVAFPVGALGRDVLVEILAGGAEVAAAAGIAIGGGHSIDDPEPKYGMAVSGTARPHEW